MAFLLNSKSATVKSLQLQNYKRSLAPLFNFSTQTKQISPTTQLKAYRKTFLHDFMDLTKFKLSLLNSIASYTMFYFHAPLLGVGIFPSLTFLFATQTIAMSTQCFGQVLESSKDALMTRTKDRPIPRGTISSKYGCFIGTGLGAASLAAYTTFEPYTWLISSGIWFSYLFMYIPMKQITPWNTFFGAIVGALPPFIGVMAQTGGIMNIETILLGAYIFSWQFPHFYGILYENKDDYKRAGFKMLSNEDPKGKQAFNQIALCTLMNSIVPLCMMKVGMINPVFLVPFYGYQLKYMKAVWEFRDNEANMQSAKKLKKTAYMPFMILLAGFMVSTAVKRHQRRKEHEKSVMSDQFALQNQ